MNGWTRLNACDACKAVSESAMPSPVRLICIFKVVMPSVVIINYVASSMDLDGWNVDGGGTSNRRGMLSIISVSDRRLMLLIV